MTMDNNSTNIINKEQQQENEILFWKVFHNIYLFNQIFQQLHSEIQYDDYSKYYIGNRIKFKQFTSIFSMLEKGLFKLIIYKLCTNQPIEVTSYCLVVLKNTIEKNKNNPIVMEELQEILKLIIKHKRYDIDSEDLIKMAIRIGDLQILEILTNPQSCDDKPFKIKGIHLELAIAIKSDLKIIQLIMDKLNPDKITTRIKSYSFYWIYTYFNRIGIKDPTFLFNVDYGNYYFKFKKNKSPISFMKSIGPIFKNKTLNTEICRSIYNKRKVNPENTPMVITTDLIHLYFICYFCKRSSISNFSLPDYIESKIKEITTNSTTNEFEKQKQLMEVLVIYTGSSYLYKFYYYNYFEIINAKSLFHCGYIKLESLNCCKELNELMKDTKTTMVNKDLIIDQISIILNKLNISQRQIIKFKHLINRIRNIIITIMDTKEYYDKSIQSIPENKRYLINLPREFNSLKQIMIGGTMKNGGKIIIQEKETIDWISNSGYEPLNCNITTSLKSEYFKKRRLGLIEFTSNHLIQYSFKMIENTITSSHLKKFQQLTYYPIKWSEIVNNPLHDTLVQLNLLNTIINEPFQLKSNQNIMYLHGICLKKSNLTLEFKPLLIYHFFQQIKLQPTTIKTKIDLQDSVSSKELVQLLFNSIIEYDLNVCKFIFSHLNFNDHLNQFNKVWQDSILNSNDKRLSNLLFSRYHIYTIKDQNPENIIVFINYWLKFIVKSTNTAATTTQSPPELISTYQLIINHLYKRLIQVQGVTIEQVSKTKQLIINQLEPHKIILEHSIYHSFYYLNIKSPLYIKFIMSVDGKSRYFNFRTISNYDCDNFEKQLLKNGLVVNDDFITTLLDPKLYTWDYIIGESFENMISNFKNSNYTQPIQDELYFYIVCNKMDLFFQFLNQIKYQAFNQQSTEMKILFKKYRDQMASNSNINFDLLKKTLEIIIEFDPEFPLMLLHVATHSFRQDILSFLIDNFNIKTIKLSLFFTFNNYYMLEYIFSNHPNIKLELDRPIIIIQYSRIPIIEILLKKSNDTNLIDHILNGCKNRNHLYTINYLIDNNHFVK